VHEGAHRVLVRELHDRTFGAGFESPPTWLSCRFRDDSCEVRSYAHRVRNRIRIGIPAAGAAAIVIGIALPTAHDLPALALGNRELLWLERTLVLFYGFLLLFVPVLRALQGELPIELSTRGARYAEASDDAVKALRDRLDQTEQLLGRTIEFINRLAD
jgi:hypothetical protein